MIENVSPACSLKERQRQQREELILQSAEASLLEKGYHDTSMDEIASRVGIAKGTLYLHFPRKEDLILALFERKVQELQTVLEQAHQIPGTAQHKLEFLLQALFLNGSGPRQKLLQALFHEGEVRSIFKEKHSIIIEKLGRGIAQLLEEGKQSGEFDRSLPTEIMLRAFISIVIMHGLRLNISEERERANEYFQHIKCLYFRGIGAVQQEQALI